jgi:hypothetical protein
MNLYYSLPFDIREKIDVTLTKMKHAELQVQLKQQLKRKVYMFFIEKCQYEDADLVLCEQRIGSFSEKDRMYQMQSLERVLDEYAIFLASL